MRRLALIALGVAVALGLLLVGLPLLLLGARPAQAACTSIPGVIGPPVPGVNLDDEQLRHVRTIIAVTHQLDLPPRAAVIAIATATQESGLRNLDHGDAAGPDSRGLFQQRLQFYGDIDPLDPAQAARAFLERLDRVPNWQTIALADAAQAVQRSAFPWLYARHEPAAQDLVERLWNTPGGLSCPRGHTGPIFIVGDSITVGADRYLRAALAARPVQIDAAVGRRLDQGLDVLTQHPDQIPGHVVVIALCTNYSGDQPGFTTLLDQTMDRATGAAAVIWVTCTEWSPAQTAANTAIRAAAGRYPNITVADWAELSRTPGHLSPDGIHPTAAGAVAYAQLIAATIPPPGPPAAGGYALPLEVTWYQTRPGWFTAPHHDYPAADIPVPVGTTVYAATAGAVISSPTGGACGNGVVIDGDDGHRYTYCHGTNSLVPQGARVAAGDPIMISGTTGASTGPHLHLQIQLGHGTGPLVCPQGALVAWATGRSVDIASLPATGCTN